MGANQRKSGTRLLASAGLAALLWACGSGDEETLTIGPVEGFAGAIAADEPRAAVVGRDVLGNGGNAADAAVAMYFTLAVTLPSRAGLGGGGACLVFDRGDKTADVVEFLPQAGASGAVVPRGARAMAALHARYGLGRWEPLVVPAENLARFGHPISRVLARDLARAAASLRSDRELSRIFTGGTGRLPGEGDSVTQSDLSSVLAGIRIQGAGYLHAGAFTRRLVEAARVAGQNLSAAELRAALPRFQAPARLRFGSETLYFPAPPADGGLLAGVMWRMLTEVRDYDSAPSDERPHLFVEAAMRAFADRASWPVPLGEGAEPAADLLAEDRLARLLADYDAARHTPAPWFSARPADRPEVPEGAGFAVGDRWGNAVACSLTMNRLFGTGRVAPDTGILLAAPPLGGTGEALSPSVAILGNEVNGDAHLALAASGGAAAPSALAAALLRVLAQDRPLEEAIAAPRLHHGGQPDRVLYEPEVPPPVLDALRARGHSLAEAPALGRIGGFYCVEGLRDSDEGCAAGSDPRGWGLGALVQ
jgi:gamma-glutamyltranspeptidase/glutathione hydrolase